MEAEQVRATLVLLGFKEQKIETYPYLWKMYKDGFSVSYAKHLGSYFVSGHAPFVGPDEIMDMIKEKFNDQRRT